VTSHGTWKGADAQTSDPLDRERLIDRREYQGLLGIARPTFERWLARKRLLPPIVLSRTCHRWRLGTVLDWMRDGCPTPAEWLKGRR
jgi:predicted DNA-binding transcriptional regulator AlpA